MHEVVTLQFGQQANYLGTHYWNTQESYFTYDGQEESPVDHDISFRPGVGADGSETYTPRTLLYDLKGAFGTLRRENALYELQQHENPAQDGPWSGRTANLQLPPIAPSPYQQALEQGSEPPQLTTETVRYWSDYNHLFYHPRSIVQLNEYELNSSLMPFEKWQTGEDLFANLDREHDLLDRDLRPFLEECDQLQALQIFTGVDDAWGGFTARYLERVADDLGKACRWVFGLKEGKQVPRERHMLQMANLAQSLQAVDSCASMHIPLTSMPGQLPSYLSLDPSSPWHTSALQAAAVESSTLPTRLRSGDSAHANFASLETTLNNDGNRRLATTSLSLSNPSHLSEATLTDSNHDARMVKDNSEDQDTRPKESRLDINMFSLAPAAAIRNRDIPRPHSFTQAQSLRGPWHSLSDLNFSNAAARSRSNLSTITSTAQTPLLFPLLPSYPKIFDFAAKPDKLAVKTCVATSTGVAGEMRRLEGIVRSIVGVEEREALCDGLEQMAEEYEEGWSEGEESGSEDG